MLPTTNQLKKLAQSTPDIAESLLQMHDSIKLSMNLPDPHVKNPMKSLDDWNELEDFIREFISLNPNTDVYNPDNANPLLLNFETDYTQSHRSAVLKTIEKTKLVQQASFIRATSLAVLRDQYSSSPNAHTLSEDNMILPPGEGLGELFDSTAEELKSAIEKASRLQDSSL